MRDTYRELVKDVPGVEIFGGDGDLEDNVWLTSIVVDSSVTGWSPAQLSMELMHDNIESRPLWKPMHLQPVFASARSLINGNSEQLFRTGITLPSGSALNDSEINRILGRLSAMVGALS